MKKLLNTKRELRNKQSHTICFRPGIWMEVNIQMCVDILIRVDCFYDLGYHGYGFSNMHVDFD